MRLWSEVNAQNSLGLDALMLTCSHGHAAVVAVLLDNGVDPNTRDHIGSALGLASAQDHLLVCQLLLGRGADLLAANAYNGINALVIYDRFKQRLAPLILEERREALRVAFAEGPHESQVQRRRDDRWARRWPSMLVLVLVGSGFRPQEARRLEHGVAAAGGQRAFWRRRGCGRAFDSAGRVRAYRVPSRQCGAARRVVFVGPGSSTEEGREERREDGAAE